MQTVNCPTEGPGEVCFSHGVIHLRASHIRYADGTCSKLSETERNLLRFFCRRPGRPVSRAEILREVWQLNPEKTRTRTVDMHIVHLRRKLRDTMTPRMLRSIRAIGYILALEQ